MAAINGIVVSLGKALILGVWGWWGRRRSVGEVEKLRLRVKVLGKDTFSIVVFLVVKPEF